VFKKWKGRINNVFLRSSPLVIYLKWKDFL
jgi:hypothetical protein